MCAAQKRGSRQHTAGTEGMSACDAGPDTSCGNHQQAGTRDAERMKETSASDHWELPIESEHDLSISVGTADNKEMRVLSQGSGRAGYRRPTASGTLHI